MARSDLKIPPATWLDRMAGWLSPRWGFGRKRYRAANALAEHFRSAVGGAAGHRLRSDWSNKTTSADSAVKYDREKIRNIARELIIGNSYAAGAINRIVANVIGRGIKPQCRLRADTPETTPFDRPPGWRPISEREARRFQTQAELLWAEFAETADITGRLTFYELQAVIERKLIEDGEVLVHFPKRPKGKGPLSFAIELIEVDRLGTPLGKFTDTNIREGVELDPETGAPVAYHVKTAHPGDDKAAVFGKFARIPRFTASGLPQIIHLFEQKRPGQTRGYSPYAPALEVFEDLHRYWEAEIMAARVGACYSAFIESPAAYEMQQAAGDTNDAGDREEKMEPGKVWYGQPGEKITFGNPNRPNTQMPSFTELLLRAIGVCLDMPFELIALDFSKTNYSSARASLLEGRRTFQRRQTFQTAQFGRPTWSMAMTEGIARGRLQAPGFVARRRDYLDSFWTPPSWGWVDPVKEETASRESIRGFLSTHADELAAQGRDFDQTVEQCAREHKRLKELELPSPWDYVIGAGGAVTALKEVEDALSE